MLTLLYDQVIVDGSQVETASAEGIEVVRSRRATCALAAALIAEGHRGDEPVRLVRADPYLFAPPHRIEGVTLSMAAVIDFFGSAGAAAIDPARATRPVSDQPYKS